MLTIINITTRPSLPFIAFLQALGITLYCVLIGWFMLHANSWFSPPPTILGPALFLLLFVVSAVICSLIFLGYPFVLFWEHKQTRAAIRLVCYSTAWLALFVLLSLLLLSFTSNRV